MVLAEGIAVSGDHVDTLDDKTFVVIDKPKYEEFPNLSDPEKKERKLVMRIELLEDNSILDYLPNKTSIKSMTKLYGFEMDNWVMKKFEFIVNLQKVAGNDRKVLYVAEKKLE
jgi:hypothetical protein